MGWVLAYGIVNASYPIITKLVCILSLHCPTLSQHETVAAAAAAGIVVTRSGMLSAKCTSRQLHPASLRHMQCFTGYQCQEYDDVGPYILQQYHDLHRLPAARIHHGGTQHHVELFVEGNANNRRNIVANRILYLGNRHFFPWILLVLSLAAALFIPLSVSLMFPFPSFPFLSSPSCPFCSPLHVSFCLCLHQPCLEPDVADYAQNRRFVLNQQND